jgi:hypothetical protein
MPTRPGYVWDATASVWVEIGQAAVVSPFKYQATAPSSPATGDIWIESDIDVPSIDSAQFLRWRKTMAGGETSLSGNDDNSLPLQYTPGYEQLYINGVLMVRGQDYTATTGTTVTGLLALTAGDTVEIFSAIARTVADVYTQSQSDTRFIPLLGNLRIKQIVSGSTTTETFSSSTTYADTTLTATITPTSASNKIVVMYQQGSIRKSGGNLNSALDLKLVRNSTDLAFHYALYTATALELRVPGPGGIVIDSPASTSALTYKTQFRNGGAFDGVAVQIQNSRGSIILIEVEGL